MKREIVAQRVIPGKRRCDCCQKKDVGEIRETQVRFMAEKSANVVHWLDLCLGCLEGLKRGALPFGPYGLPSPAKSRQFPVANAKYVLPTYGPRPMNGGFQCRDCQSTAYPLFGRGGLNLDFTYCKGCLLKRYPTAFAPGNATNDARKVALDPQRMLDLAAGGD